MTRITIETDRLIVGPIVDVLHEVGVHVDLLLPAASKIRDCLVALADEDAEIEVPDDPSQVTRPGGRSEDFIRAAAGSSLQYVPANSCGVRFQIAGAIHLYCDKIVNHLGDGDHAATVTWRKGVRSPAAEVPDDLGQVIRLVTDHAAKSFPNDIMAAHRDLVDGLRALELTDASLIAAVGYDLHDTAKALLGTRSAGLTNAFHAAICEQVGAVLGR